MRKPFGDKLLNRSRVLRPPTGSPVRASFCFLFELALFRQPLFFSLLAGVARGLKSVTQNHYCWMHAAVEAATALMHFKVRKGTESNCQRNGSKSSMCRWSACSSTRSMTCFGTFVLDVASCWRDGFSRQQQQQLLIMASLSNLTDSVWYYRFRKEK